MKPYLLVFNDLFVPEPVNRKSITNYLDTRPEVLNWYTTLSNGIFVISEKNPTELTNIIHSKFPALWFVITEVMPNHNSGFLPKQAWEFINKPKSVRGQPPPGFPPVPKLPRGNK